MREQLNGGALFGLVNNSGIAVPAPLMDQLHRRFSKADGNQLDRAIDRHAGFSSITGHRSLSEGNPGRVINMSSVSGKRGYPFRELCRFKIRPGRIFPKPSAGAYAFTGLMSSLLVPVQWQRRFGIKLRISIYQSIVILNMLRLLGAFIIYDRRWEKWLPARKSW